MDLSSPVKPPKDEAIIPMINVVFLLLIFFLMTAQIAPPEPFEVTPPVADIEGDPESDAVVYVDKAARLHFDGHEGAQAILALKSLSNVNAVVKMRADANLPAKDMAKLLRQLSGGGLSRVELIVGAK